MDSVTRDGEGKKRDETKRVWFPTSRRRSRRAEAAAKGARHGRISRKTPPRADGGGIGPTHAEEARARAAEEDPGAGAAEDDARRPAGDAAGRVCGEERRRGRGGVESRAPRGVRMPARADAAAAASAARALSAGCRRGRRVRRAARTNPPGVADIIDKVLKHRPSTTADEAFPLDSFRAAAGDGLASARGRVRRPRATSPPARAWLPLGAGSAANNKALWQWNQTLAMLSGQAGHPAGAFVDPSSPYASLFAAPASPAELKRVRDANGHALSEVATSLEAVRRCAAAVCTARGDSTDPSARAALVAKLERALRGRRRTRTKSAVSARGDGENLGGSTRVDRGAAPGAYQGARRVRRGSRAGLRGSGRGRKPRSRRRRGRRRLRRAPRRRPRFPRSRRCRGERGRARGVWRRHLVLRRPVSR